ncbi:hypothetical protein BAR24066_01872 [Burkholderia arboris]|uniref:Uncharacterized protein n=1 Tax=Burkholderia arboris TaxID=488730 RepID=A0A9Q9SG43_9BURK|nr:hypothetical protein BAR24066_01872 [Burkholderia arboris]
MLPPAGCGTRRHSEKAAHGRGLIKCGSRRSGGAGNAYRMQPAEPFGSDASRRQNLCRSPSATTTWLLFADGVSVQTVALNAGLPLPPLTLW